VGCRQWEVGWRGGVDMKGEWIDGQGELESGWVAR